MSSQLIDELIKDFNEKLGERSFYTLPELVSLGLFGTMPKAREALKDGKLPFIRVSQRRCVVPQQSLIQFLLDGIEKDDFKKEEELCSRK